MEGEHLNSSVVFQILGMGYFIRKNQWAKKGKKEEFSNFTHTPLYILA